MAAEFESLWQPFIIMFTVPLSLIGVSLILFITQTPLSVVAYLGIIMLGGIVVNNGIVLIDFINRMRKEGRPPKEAVVVACKTRLRPILMTSFTTILGLAPLALGIGEGAELRAPLALTVIGGLSSATFLTLIVIPALYLIVAERIKPKTEAVEMPQPEEEIPPEEKVEPEEKGEIQAEKRVGLEEKAEVKAEEEVKPEEKVELEGLNERQAEILEKLKTIKKITRKQYAEMFSISIPTAARDLKELLKRKLLRACGPLGPGRWYELC